MTEKGKCERCKGTFTPRWKFNESEHTIDNHICPRCYGYWVGFTDGGEIKIGNKTFKVGQKEFWEAFLESIREKVCFT